MKIKLIVPLVWEKISPSHHAYKLEYKRLVAMRGIYSEYEDSEHPFLDYNRNHCHPSPVLRLRAMGTCQP